MNILFPFSVSGKLNTEIKIALIVIAMLLIAVTNLGFVMSKDAQYTVTRNAEEKIVVGLYDMVPQLTSTIEHVDFQKAPNVKGMKEDTAKKKLGSFEVRTEKKKMTFEELVAMSDTAFFGEVTEQKQSRAEVLLEIPEPDVTDPLTVEMMAIGGRLAWPVPSSHTITSHFGHRSSPGGIGSTNHQGMDIGAMRGAPIIAALDGTVKLAAPNGGYGNCVIIDHGNGYETLYGHMSAITCNVGDQVKAGDTIGKVGSTGWSTGPHLHFGVLKNGVYMDPEPYLTGQKNLEAGDEVSENLLDTESETNSTSTKKDKETSTESQVTDPTEPVDQSGADNTDKSSDKSDDKKQEKKNNTDNSKKQSTPKPTDKPKTPTTPPTDATPAPTTPSTTTAPPATTTAPANNSNDSAGNGEGSGN